MTTQYTAKTAKAMSVIALQFLPQECITLKGKELRLVCPEETDELLLDMSNYSDDEWIGPHGKALNAIKNAFTDGGYEILTFSNWYCIRPGGDWTPSKELVFNNID
jgi:hypothetical protein